MKNYLIILFFSFLSVLLLPSLNYLTDITQEQINRVGEDGNEHGVINAEVFFMSEVKTYICPFYLYDYSTLASVFYFMGESKDGYKKIISPPPDDC